MPCSYELVGGWFFMFLLAGTSAGSTWAVASCNSLLSDNYWRTVLRLTFLSLASVFLSLYDLCCSSHLP